MSKKVIFKNVTYSSITDFYTKNKEEIEVSYSELLKNINSGILIENAIKKQPRKKFECSNVIYILTTPSLIKDKRYILGKAKNLTNRLSTYNKTEEHEIIFYQECDDEEIMNLLEPLVFKKLEDYREQANRERFILPETKNIDFFIDKIKECVKFLK